MAAIQKESGAHPLAGEGCDDFERLKILTSLSPHNGIELEEWLTTVRSIKFDAPDAPVWKATVRWLQGLMRCWQESPPGIVASELKKKKKHEEYLLFLDDVFVPGVAYSSFRNFDKERTRRQEVEGLIKTNQHAYQVTHART